MAYFDRFHFRNQLHFIFQVLPDADAGVQVLEKLILLGASAAEHEETERSVNAESDSSR